MMIKTKLTFEEEREVKIRENKKRMQDVLASKAALTCECCFISCAAVTSTKNRFLQECDGESTSCTSCPKTSKTS
jgi:hypothetical protein